MRKPGILFHNYEFIEEADMNISIQVTKEAEALELSNIQKEAFQPLYEQYHDEGNPCLCGAEDIANRLNSEYFRYFTIFLEDEIVGGILYKCKGSTPFGESLGDGRYYSFLFANLYHEREFSYICIY